ncbi:LytR family transcriptional regulator [Streptomyces armeniacus]|uniref:LytR family transcriptional regulator n=2 Tax=Streptomyces armeniacus TaxID=83291 RepID=A0A345Y1M2_9ACTN|nr:LytR family transcriptional regulator [Streptomyces armeniacus]
MPDGAARPAPGPGLNFLLVGLDRRAGLTDEEKDWLHVNGEACDCTDTMMLLHLSEDRRRISVVSIPRDSYVAFPRGGAPAAVPAAPGTAARPAAGKINAAHKLGGPALTVRTVEQATGVRVDHYLEADFGSFVEAVDEIGGAGVCTAKALRDKNSGLRLPAGTHRLDGRNALRYVRARHVPPLSGDLGRMRRQQRFVAELLDTFSDQGLFRNPAALAMTARSLLRTLRADEDLSTGRLLTLGRALGELDSADTEFATVPLADFDHRVKGWGSTLTWDRPRAARLFAALREDRPLTTEEAYSLPGPGVPVAWPPADIPVRVHAAPERARAADTLERGLRASGFDVRERTAPAPGAGAGTGTGTGEAPPGQTEISYDPRWQRKAESLAAALPDTRLRPVPGHPRVFEVRPGPGAARVERVVLDRSSVEGAPARGDTLDCDDAPAG